MGAKSHHANAGGDIMTYEEVCREFIRKYREQQITEADLPLRLRAIIWVNGEGTGPMAAKKFYEQLRQYWQ